MLRAFAFRIALAGFLVALLPRGGDRSLQAQARTPSATSSRQGWLPRSDLLGSTTPPLIRVTADDRREARARLLAIEQLLGSTETLARPDGFEVMPQFRWGGAGVREARDGVVPYALILYFFMPSRAIDGETSTIVTITVNPSAEDIARQSLESTHDTGLWLEDSRLDYRRDLLRDSLRPAPERVRSDRAHDYVVYAPYYAFGPKTDYPDVPSMGTVLLTPAGSSPWLSVSRELYLRTVIANIEGGDSVTFCARADTFAMSPLELWLADASNRRRIREETIAGVAASAGSAEAARLREQLERSERDVTAQLRASEPRDRERGREASKSPMVTAILRDTLASLTPDQRRSEAWLSHLGGLPFHEATDTLSRRAVRANPAFYRRDAGRPVAPHGILVHFEGTGAGRAIVQSLRRSLDWAALAAMLDAPQPGAGGVR